MDNKKDNIYYLKQIVKDLGFIVEHTTSISKDKLRKDEVLLDSVMFRLIQISENSVRLDADFKSRYSEVPWQAIKGMRNKIVHDYGQVDLSIVFETVSQDVPELYKLLSKLI